MTDLEDLRKRYAPIGARTCVVCGGPTAEMSASGGLVVIGCTAPRNIDTDAFEAEHYRKSLQTVPASLPTGDPSVLALCDEVEALRARVAAAPILAEHAAAVSLLAASPVGDLGFVEGIEALRAQLAATLRLGRGPTAEEFRRHNATGGGWLLQGVGEDMGGWTMEMRPIPEADIPAMVRFTRDAIPLDASRQPCGVGVKV